MREGEEVLDGMPGEDLGEGVRAEDEVEVGLRPAYPAQLTKGVDGVARAWPVDLDTTR